MLAKMTEDQKRYESSRFTISLEFLQKFEGRVCLNVEDCAKYRKLFIEICNFGHKTPIIDFHYTIKRIII